MKWSRFDLIFLPINSNYFQKRKEISEKHMIYAWKKEMKMQSYVWLKILVNKLLKSLTLKT